MIKHIRTPYVSNLNQVKSIYFNLLSYLRLEVISMLPFKLLLSLSVELTFDKQNHNVITASILFQVIYM